jgi:hypothetical protein
MNAVFGKVGTSKDKNIFKILSDETIFQELNINIDSCVTYDVDHNLDEDSWFKIDKFTHQDYCLDFLKKEFQSVNYSSLDKEKLNQIKYVFSTKNKKFYFQKITKTSFINKGFIIFGEEFEFNRDIQTKLVINQFPDAVYCQESNTLIFRDFQKTKAIFTGMEVLYKEATNEEVEEFLKASFISLTPEFSAKDVLISNRKRIKLVIEKLKELTSEDIDYINQYCESKLDYDSKTQQFSISSNEDLKSLIYGIDERYFTTRSGEKRLANSIKKLD